MVCSDDEIKQIALCFGAGIFPSTLLALAAQLVLVPLWASLCFYDQRASLTSQLQQLLDSDDSSSSSSHRTDDSVDALAGSGSGALSSAVQTPPHASRLADVLQQLDVDKTLGYYVFLFAMAFCIAALVEESLKLWIVQGACCCSTTASSRSSRTTKRGWLCHPSRLLFQLQRHSSHSFVVFVAVVAGALGFSFCENVGYVFSASAFSDRVLTAVLRGVVSTPLHCLCGGITGVRLAERMQRSRRTTSSREKLAASAADDLASWRTKWQLIAPAVAVHGTFDFQVFLVASSVTEDMVTAHPLAYGIVLPSVGPVVILVGAFWYLRRSLDAMEQTMNAGRYIQVAVDLESGRRVGFSDDDSESDDDDFIGGSGLSVADGYDASRTGARKSRSVFNV